MKEEKGNLEELLKQELLKEAEAIRYQVNQREDLKDVVAPESLDEKLAEKIRQVEGERIAQEQFSEETKESIRLGKEAQMLNHLELLEVDEEEKEEAVPSQRYKKKPWKLFLLIAAAATLILAMGLTSLGGPPFILNMMNDALGNREMTRMDSEREGTEEYLGEVSEEERFYQEVKETFNTDVVRLLYLPSHTKFVMGDIDETGSLVCMVYQCEEQMIECRIVVNYQTRSYGYDISDELMSEKRLEVSGNIVEIKEYKLPDESHQFVAQYKYKNNAYILNSTISGEEFEKIIKNLKFF